jgi:hypothetical protein
MLFRGKYCNPKREILIKKGKEKFLLSKENIRNQSSR